MDNLVRIRQPGWKALVLLAGALIQLTCAHPDGAYLYVSNEREGTISVIDTLSDKVVREFKVGARPRGIRLSPDESRLYVALSTPMGKPQDPADSKILALDPKDGRVLASYQAGSDPEQLAVSQDGARLYASNEDAGTATVIDVASGKILANPVVGIEPEGAIVSPNGKWVYITAETSNTISVIDTATNQVIATFLVGARPRDAAFSSDSKFAYVTSETGQSVAVVDTGGHRVIDTIKLELGSLPVGILVAPDGKHLFVANGRANNVLVIDIATRQTIAKIPAGSRVWGLGLTADGKKLYATGGLSDDISVIDSQTYKVLSTIKVGAGPWGIAAASR